MNGLHSLLKYQRLWKSESFDRGIFLTLAIHLPFTGHLQEHNYRHKLFMVGQSILEITHRIRAPFTLTGTESGIKPFRGRNTFDCHNFQVYDGQICLMSSSNCSSYVVNVYTIAACYSKAQKFCSLKHYFSHV